MKLVFQKNILVFVSFWFSCFSFAQKRNSIDSLKQFIKNIPANKLSEKASMLIFIGQKYMSSSDYLNAMDCYQQSLALAQQINNDTLIANCYYHLSIIAFYQKDFYKDSTYSLKALEIYRRINDKNNEGLLLKGIADDYLERGNLTEARKYYADALPIILMSKDKRLEAAIYSNQAILFQSDYRKKIELGLLAKKIWDENPSENVLPLINIGNLGVAYLDIVRYKGLKAIKPDTLISANSIENLKIAESYLRQAIQMARQKNDPENKSYYTGVLAELQAYKGDYKNAYENIRSYYDTQDSLYSQENKNKLAALESLRAIDLKNKEIQNKELLISNQRKNLWLLGSLIGFLAILGSLFYRQSIIRKKTNTTLARLNYELDNANKVKAKFFGIISHDLRSPVANLINFVQLQKRKPGIMSEEQIAERENKISDAAKSLLEKMEATLLWSKGQMDHFKPDISVVPVKKLFDHLQQFFAETENTSISFSGAENLVIQTDENFLKTIMQNLTANGIKALQQKPNGQINWKAWQQKGKVFLSITDNGDGVSQQQLKALYDEKTSSGTKHGLGLHIIRDLAKAIGCNITLKQDQGLGTTFVLSLSN